MLKGNEDAKDETTQPMEGPATITAIGNAQSENNEQAVQEANEILNKLRSMDIEIRMQAFQRLHIVAKVAGPKQTREELVPLLDELTDDIPKTLVVLAEQLGVLASMLGGTEHEHAHMVLRGLEVLVQGDELLVREQAASSIARVVCLLPKEHIGTHVMTMMERLSEGTFFNSRLAGCLLVGQLYSKVSKEEQHVLLQMYVVKYCTDENPAVRREAVRQMSALCEVMEPELVKENILPVVQKLPKDLQTSVRLLLPTACVAVSRAMRRGGNEAGGLTEVIEVMEVMAKDDAWRVRFTLATNYTELWTLVTPDEKQEDAMLASFVAFAHDTEPEVRCAAAKNLAGVARSLTRKDDAKQVLIEAVNFLQHDNSVFVRAALATVITSLAVLLSTTRVPEGLLPAILRLLKDDNPEVVLNVVGTLTADFNRIVGVHSLSTALLPSIKELATSRDWRNRMKLITHTPLIAGHLDRVLFSDHLSAICMDWLGDSVFSVRQAAAVNLAQLAQIFGAEWAKSFLIPKFISLSVHRSYIYRMMSLTAAKDMAPVVGKELATSHLLQVVLTLADDRVANVRVSVARTLSCLLPHLVPAAVHALAAPKLLLLLEDDDVDVRYYAACAIEELHERTPLTPPPTPMLKKALGLRSDGNVTTSDTTSDTNTPTTTPTSDPLPPTLGNAASGGGGVGGNAKDIPSSSSTTITNTTTRSAAKTAAAVLNASSSTPMQESSESSS